MSATMEQTTIEFDLELPKMIEHHLTLQFNFGVGQSLAVFENLLPRRRFALDTNGESHTTMLFNFWKTFVPI